MFNKILIFFLARLAGEKKRAFFYNKILGVKFGENTRITGIPSFGSEPFLITIGNNVTITQGVTFHNHDGGIAVLRNKYPNTDFIRPINIGNNVFIGSNATIMPGVTIGNNVVIGSSSVITKDIPSDVVVAGVPGRILKSIEEYEKKIIPQTIVLKNRYNQKARKEELLKLYNQI
jgi:acetyltransferase-like isoleucine patch superfamily enzyme